VLFFQFIEHAKTLHRVLTDPCMVQPILLFAIVCRINFVLRCADSDTYISSSSSPSQSVPLIFSLLPVYPPQIFVSHFLPAFFRPASLGSFFLGCNFDQAHGLQHTNSVLYSHFPPIVLLLPSCSFSMPLLTSLTITAVVTCLPSGPPICCCHEEVLTRATTAHCKLKQSPLCGCSSRYLVHCDTMARAGETHGASQRWVHFLAAVSLITFFFQCSPLPAQQKVFKGYHKSALAHCIY
jgi:hypothetical protein